LTISQNKNDNDDKLISGVFLFKFLSYIELADVGVKFTVFLFNKIFDVSWVMALDVGPTAGLYPNPDVGVSEIVSVENDDADGNIISSLDMVSTI
jgi:hypothetical protein